MRPPPPDGRATLILGYLTIAVVVYLILVSCGGQPGRYDRSLEPPVLSLDWRARAITDDGETIEIRASERYVCAAAVNLARRFGRSWIIRPAKLRLASVSGCVEERAKLRIDVQRVMLR